MVVWWTGEVFSIPFSSSLWRELRFSSPSLTIISTGANGMPLVLVVEAFPCHIWLVCPVVILQWFPNANSEVLGPSGASALHFWESSCVSSISVEELHAHCCATCSFPAFRNFISIKIPFLLEAGSWAKFSSHSTLLNMGNLYQLPWSWPSFYPGLEQSIHPWAGCAGWAGIASTLPTAWQMGYSKWI